MGCEPMQLRGASFAFDDERRRTYVMGVVNVTPDSFSDGGRYLGREAAIARGRELGAAGADLLDVGGESTRPGAAPVDAAEEWARIGEVIAALAALPVPVSVDTYKAEVAGRALAAGAQVVNDVSGGALDPAILDVAARADAVMVLGHLRGDPRTMQKEIAFADVFEEVTTELAAVIARARAAGVRRIVADPGLGFGKTAAHNLVLLGRAGELSDRLGVPVMVGPSRKAFLGQLTGLPVDERGAATLGSVVAAALRGAQFVRVHDVAPARHALAVADAVVAAARASRGAP